jgi:hypothetical protein
VTGGEVLDEIWQANKKYVVKPDKPHRSEWRKLQEIQLIQTANELNPPHRITTAWEAKRWIVHDRIKLAEVEDALDYG